jgi:hypothetical protein
VLGPVKDRKNRPRTVPLPTVAEWEATLVSAGVTGVEVSNGAFSEFTISSATVRDNGFVASVTHPRFGPHLRHGPVVTLSATPGTPGPACLVSQHTSAVLAELATAPRR